MLEPVKTAIKNKIELNYKLQRGKIPLEIVALFALRICKSKKIMLLCKKMLSQANYEIHLMSYSGAENTCFHLCHLSIDYFFPSPV